MRSSSILFALGLICFSFLISSCSSTGRMTQPAPADRGIESPIVSTAKNYLGSRYRFGAAGPRQFDCSGFVYYVHQQHNINPGRTTSDQSQSGTRIRPNQAVPGDLLFFGKGRKMQHVGIVVSNNGSSLQMIHASSSRGVIIEDVYASPYWSGRLRFAVRGQTRS